MYSEPMTALFIEKQLK